MDCLVGLEIDPLSAATVAYYIDLYNYSRL